MSTSSLSQRVQQLAESQTIGMAKLSRELASKGIDVINLSLGEPDFVTPSHIREAAKKAIDDGFTFYPPIAGYAELRKAISAKFQRENQLDYKPDQVVVSTGAKQAIANVVLCLVNPGDEVIIPLPYWVSYIEIVKLAEGKTVAVNTTVEADFKMTAEQLEAAITPRTKLLIFSSPCNPTGSVYTREELEAIAKVLARHPQVYILSDEIYEHINFLDAHQSIAQFESVRDRVIIVNGVSKGYAMTGWRIGYIGAPKFIADACDKMQGQFTSAASSIAQKAAEAALNLDNRPTLDMRDAFLRRRDLVIEGLKKIPGLRLNQPKGAFYVFPDISSYFGKSDGTTTIHNATDLCMYLLNTGHVSVVTGEAFGAPNCFRLSYAASDDKLKEAVRRIGDALAKLR
ncbi:MAG: pyridoxal phosphate-dependent aminotransferase [Bacteroidota bacterium]|mgnify:FL=1|uniref:pyridoxal phosphate-dependent aminotransferase n=1 Tax=Candidatus Pollutiaquabacter sp. TaxID=3416354 RepID=UPI001A4314E4|nr:pyridoxal phosphate-dependent aminotransferase [Bacteroidota bacterium]MBL7950047.1 pyridoxal phosphate-dependent aminotransferase [Bacteroidia bacterium]MBP6010325.1 pyridoxal phosphate-dependent aminotransferase [Bacteroidia bacterium]MBP7271091.1 pyridoxal phosphate-dependent aminotransferase [Bacteroidia bacterium]MBP7437646.1 pyridoxal phosphate-dependent aminotransferase [Bacteroidia bacterium]